MVQIYSRNIKEGKVNKLLDYKNGAWVHLSKPTEEEVVKVSKMLKIDESLILDALDPVEMPRVEREGGVDYIFTRIPVEKQEQVSTTTFLFAVSSDIFLTVSGEETDPLEWLQKRGVEFYTTQKTKLLILLFLQINSFYNNFINAITKKIRHNSIKIERLQNKDIAQFVNYEAVFNDFLSALEPTSVVLSSLLSGKHLRLYDEDRELVEDLLLSINQLIEASRSNLTHISNIREAYSTIISNNLNKTMKLLTSFTFLLTIPTMIASFFGMNVSLPFTDNTQAFWGILGGTLTLSVVLLIIFWKNDFL